MLKLSAGNLLKLAKSIVRSEIIYWYLQLQNL